MLNADSLQGVSDFHFVDTTGIGKLIMIKTSEVNNLTL